MPRPGLPLVVTRACIRVGLPEAAMSYVRDEVQYGLFPSTRVYNVIMDAMLKKNKSKGVCVCVCVEVRESCLITWHSLVCWLVRSIVCV